MFERLHRPITRHTSATSTPTLWWWLWSAMLALVWLVPNHFKPWTAFHTDAWMAVVGLVGTLALLWRVRSPIAWTSMSAWVLVLTLLPWVHYAVGLLPFAGQAWISSLYLLGLLLALLIGARWERAYSGQLEQALLMAVGLACLASVGLQWHTWLGLGSSELTDIWSMGLIGARPYANLGQPNNLATLLLWGLLAVFWAYLRALLGTAVTVLAAMFLLLGLALTQSRTGLLAFTVVLCAIWYWHELWPRRGFVWMCSGLYVFYWSCPGLLRWLYCALQLGTDINLLRLPQQGEQRLNAWQLFWQASWERPWFGYGISDVRAAQVAVAEHFASLGITFAQSHNLFLDLVLWVGWPLGLLLCGLLVRWAYQRGRAIRQAGDAILFMMLLVIGLHALLELPLHYAYFLIPTGWLVGILDARLGARVLWHSPRWSLSGLWLIALLLVGLVVRDYLQVEDSYTALRFEQAHIGKRQPSAESQPDVLLLTQLRAMIQASRIEVKAGMSSSELEHLHHVTTLYPSRDASYRLAQAYALNGRPQDASDWLQIGCRLIAPDECRLLQQRWQHDAQTQPSMSSVAWPEPSVPRPDTLP